VTTSISKNEWNTLLARAEGGDSEAQYDVGCYFEEGVIVAGTAIVVQSLHKAFEWFQKSAGNGYVEGLTRVADYLSEGTAVEKNLDMAIELYEKAIKKGSGIAANNLGIVYRDKGDLRKAFDFYKESQRLFGYDYSLKVALCLYYGIGAEEDRSKAFKMFKEISDDQKGSCTQYEIDQANFLLGQIYLQGDVVTKSIAQARKYLMLADKDADHYYAKEILQIIC
jgi:uncharacterized protein